MSEATQAGSQLNRLREWRDDYRSGLAPSALQNIGQLSAQLDMTHAHPSGIAQLFASGHAKLDSMFRDAGMLRAAGRQLERVFADQEAKARTQGVADLSLVVGVAKWKGNAVPVLLYPVEVDCDAEGREGDSVIRFTGSVQLNPAFSTLMRDQRIDLNEAELFDERRYEGGSPDTSAVFEAISDKAATVFAEFDIERDIVLGCFMDPAMQMFSESQRIIDELEDGPTGNVVLDAIAGDEQSAAELDEELPPYSPFDNDPHNEYEVGDVDNVVRYAANLAGTGHSLFVNTGIGNDTALDAVTIASRCVAASRSVLYVPCVDEQKRRFVRAASQQSISPLVLDVAGSNSAHSLDKRLIGAVSFQPGTATAHFDQLADELVGVRSRLTRYLGDLHTRNERWGVSAYETIQNLAEISALPTRPVTQVRLPIETAQSIADELPKWSGKLQQAGEYGEFTVNPEDTAWYNASLYTERDAEDAYECVEKMLESLLPSMRSQVTSIVETCGFPVPNTIDEWNQQVVVLQNLRRVLDIFQPEIFERDIDAMIEATVPKEERKAQGSDMSFMERKRLEKEARKLERAGAHVEDLHVALKIVAKQAAEWRTLSPHGGWPVLPARLDAIQETQDVLMQCITKLNSVLATTAQGANLESAELAKLDGRLRVLYSDHEALETLPGRASLEREFRSAGFTDLVEDLRARAVPVEAVDGELQLAWWTTVFEDIVSSSEIISNQDGMALESAADRFNKVDQEHLRAVGPMIDQESMRRLSDMLFSNTQEANQLHTELASGTRFSLERTHRAHSTILAMAKPIIVATPSTLAALSDPEPLADVAIIDAGAHMPSIALLSAVSRAKQVVVLAHRDTVTSPALKILIDMLPTVTVEPRPMGCDPRLLTFLTDHDYGKVRYDVASADRQGKIRLHQVEANGVPVLATGLIESSQQEIDEVIRIITERFGEFTSSIPVDYTLAVVTLTSVFRSRLGVELKSLAVKDKAMSGFLRHVRLVSVDEAVGAKATDVILSLSVAKTAHGRLMQHFGTLEGVGGDNKLLDALALTNRDLDIVAAFGSQDMEAERLHQSGPQLLKVMLSWAEQLDGAPVRPAVKSRAGNVIFNDLASRLRVKGFDVAVDYGFDDGIRIPLVAGKHGESFSVAVLADDEEFMSMSSVRRQHRLLRQDLELLGWSVITVWGVAAFVNPDKEVDRIASHVDALFKDER